MLFIFYALLALWHSYTNAQYSPTCSRTGSVRLYNTATDEEGEGAVQICYSGAWYSVCDYNWDCADANVVCRQLGYTYGADSNSDNYFGNWVNIYARRYSCSGSESSLNSCSSASVASSHCLAHSNAAGVRCAQPDLDTIACSPNGAVQMDNGTETTEGIVKYCYNGQWTPFCQFDDEEATVTCKQLGYSPYGSIIDYSYNDYSLISSISCSTYATENNLQSCSISPIGSSSCTPVCSSVVAIRCYDYDYCTDGDVRLVNGSIYQEGRIEICVNGVWGSICGDGWSTSTSTGAFVVCKQLGFTDSVPEFSRMNRYGVSDRPVVYYGVFCHGWERSITECTKSEYLNFTCSSTYAAGVLCTDGCYDDTVRLVGPSDLEGTIEVCINNLWGLIGDAGWDNTDAIVVCRQLGLPTGGAKAILGSTKTNHTIHYSYIRCEGQELQLQDCEKISFSLDDGSAIYDEATVAGVVCAETTELPQPNNNTTCSFTDTTLAVVVCACISICINVLVIPICVIITCLMRRKKKRLFAHRPLPPVVVTRSHASAYRHGDDHHDHLILHSSDEEESDQQDEEKVKIKDIDTNDRFPTTKEAVHNPYQKNGENVYEDAD